MFGWIAVAIGGTAILSGEASDFDGETAGVPPRANAEAAVSSPVSPPAASEPFPAIKDVDPGKVDDLLNLDLGQLSNVRVRGRPQETNLTAPSGTLDSGKLDFNEAGTTGQLAEKLPSVNARRTSGINLDPRVRGYHYGQLVGTADGMTQLKTRVDIDSLFSQIDPGVVQEITVIDGPYTSLYGPGFAFLNADLVRPARYAQGPEAHGSTFLTYGSNGQTLYNRDNVWGGGRDWGMYISYGLRVGNDYHPGGSSFNDLVPASYQKWDGLFAFSFDVGRNARIDLGYLRTEMNDVELPGIVYDVNNSRNDQFNLRYVVQEDRQGPEQLVFQSWYTHTSFGADASRASKQQSLYRQFFTLPAFFDNPVNTLANGRLDSLGVRLLRTFGEADSPQWTIGVDWRRYGQRYVERDVDPSGTEIFGGNLFGIPKAQMDDGGVLTDVFLPISEQLSVNVGGRVDQSRATFDRNDPVVTQITDPDEFYFMPGYDQPSRTLGMAYATGKLKLTERHTFNLGVGFAMRPPDLAELYSDDPYVPIARFGNSYASGVSNLLAEQNLQVDFGITARRKTFSYGARGFYSTIRDYITPVPAFIDPTPPDFIDAPKVMGRNFRFFPPQWRTDLGTPNENADTCQAGYLYANIDLAVLYGGDVFGEAQLSDWLWVFGSMSYVRGVNVTPVVFVDSGSWVASEGQFVPIGRSEGLLGMYPFNGALGVRLVDPERDRWELEFSSRMVARQDYLAVSLSELSSPGFATFDLRGHYRLRERLRLTMAIENLLNKNYVDPGSLVIVNSNGVPTYVKEPGISAILGVEARF